VGAAERGCLLIIVTSVQLGVAMARATTMMMMPDFSAPPVVVFSPIPCMIMGAGPPAGRSLTTGGVKSHIIRRVKKTIGVRTRVDVSVSFGGVSCT
jgi:hypothetical protein